MIVIKCGDCDKILEVYNSKKRFCFNCTENRKKEYRKKYNQDHKEEIKQYYLDNKEKVKEYYGNNIDHILEKKKEDIIRM